LADLPDAVGTVPLRRQPRVQQHRRVAVDAATGRLTPAGHASTEAVPTAFGLDPTGSFLFAAGTASGRLASYRVNGATGALTPLEIYTVGQRPAAVLAVALSG
jgi:6-phosphogluconolactonase (cycloisomerase 2 family)